MLLALLLATTFTSDPRCAPIRLDVGQRVIDATTLAELDEAAKSIAENEFALRSLYRTRRLEMNPTAEEELHYFRALPKTARELWCIYGLTYEGAFQSVGAANDASCGIYDRAPRIARKLGIGHKLMIDMALWSDGEVAEHGWDAFYWLIENDPELMAEALKRYPQNELRGCDGPLRAEMSVAEVVRRCRDQR